MKYIQYILLSLAALAMSACSFFHEDPRHDITKEDLIIDAASLYTSTVAPLYSEIGSATDGKGLQGTYRGVYDLQTFTADDVIIPVRGGDWVDGGVWMALFNHTWQADNEITTNAWNYLFHEVVQCNNALQLIAEYKDLLTTAQLTEYRAEVRALRAMYYFYLLDLYARVPIIDETTTQNAVLKQSERHEVFEFCWNELQSVIDDLPHTHSNLLGTYYGHITQPVAAFLLMKLALNAEIYSDDNWTDNIFPQGTDIMLSCGGAMFNAWQAVILYGKQIDGVGYSLDAAYTDPFEVHNETSNENIFTIPMSQTMYLSRYKYQFRSWHYQHGGAVGYGGENGSCATLEALNIFKYNTPNTDERFQFNFYADTLYINGSPLTLSNGQTLVYQPLEVKQDLTGSQFVATAGARMYKYMIDPKGIFDGTLRENDIVLFRYADVLLMMSEAKVRNSENGDLELNQVRQRANMGIVSATLHTILDERCLELCWEGWRRQDLIRMRQFTRALSLSERQQVAGEQDSYGFTTVFPIPQSVIDMNPSFTQNPGY